MADFKLVVRGLNGQVELTDTVLRIKREGAIAFLSQGFKGEKEILVSHISSVQFKKCNALMNGYIQFAFVGGQEAKRGIFQGTMDENTVMFRESQQADFEALREELNKRMKAANKETGAFSPMEEIEKLATLRDKGIVSEEEFQQKKTQLLKL